MNIHRIKILLIAMNIAIAADIINIKKKKTVNIYIGSIL